MNQNNSTMARDKVGSQQMITQYTSKKEHKQDEWE